MVKINTKNRRIAFLSDIELLNRSRITVGVVGHTNSNERMLRRSTQLILVAENAHFEGRAELKAE